MPSPYESYMWLTDYFVISWLHMSKNLVFEDLHTYSTINTIAYATRQRLLDLTDFTVIAFPTFGTDALEAIDAVDAGSTVEA